MADADWKKRVGIPINYNSSSGDDEDDDHSVEYRVKTTVPIGLDIPQDHDVDLRRQSDELALKFEEYGSTPPRTRMKNKIRDWDRRQQKNDLKVGGRGASRLARSRANRRNTVDCAILNELFIDDDSKRNDKRSQHLLRESERDQKISTLAPLTAVPSLADLNNKSAYEERAESMPMVRNSRNLLAIVPKLIECSNRYMSVSSRPVGCRTSAPPSAFLGSDNQTCQFDRSKMQTRRDFHETFANLIKLGSTCEKQESKISHEDYTWQTELKDLIWLELQAWHADRSLDQQDKYLYTARQGIPDLLEQILNYKFMPRYGREISLTSDDSGNASDGSPHNWENVHLSGRNLSAQNCVECFSLYCKLCQRQQSSALREVEELLIRLETAESLYPSSQVMGTCHPIYKCELFVGRVKAMCLWYNITKHQRLKLALIGKFFKKLQGRDFKWPMSSTSQHPADSSTSSSTADYYDDSGRESLDSALSVKSKKSPTKVKFIDECGDVTSSQDSVSSTEGKEADDYTDKFRTFINEDDTTVTKKPYRKYIEHILKSRGLGRSLSFLHRLYTVVLRKTQITLEKPGTEDVDFDMEMFEESPQFTHSTFMPPIDKEQEEELRRYGGWSPEAQSLGLPSYAPTFVFLSVIPLEIMHEYLKMRVESRPLTPNPLSLEQLIKELREGLILSMTHRERYNKHIHTALYDRHVQMEKYMQILDEFDATVREVVAIYFDYVEQWVLDAAPEDHRKSALNKEWTFTKLISPMIAGNHAFAAKKFCSIVGFLLQRTGNRLINRATRLKGKIDETPIVIADDDKRWQILTICREIQGLFTVERDNSLKVLNFAKALCRDLESPDFHRDHEVDGTSMICQEVKDAVMELQIEVLSVRHKLTKIIEHVQQRCDIKNLADIDEVDRIAITTRTREILHQGFKFGFDYHKELVRLFENKIIVQKDKVCEFNLSLGIIHFAKMWMVFVTEKCERGRGVRPRWAAQGLEFLIAACDPVNTKHLTESEFDSLKSKMDACISHVVGIVSEPEKIRKRSSPRTRKISPAASRALTPTRTLSPRLVGNEDQRLFLHQFSMKEENGSVGGIGGGGLSPNSAPTTPLLMRKTNSIDGDTTDISLKVPKMPNFIPVLRQVRIRDAINHLDMELDNQLRERNLIGLVKTLKNSDKHHIGARSVCFRWHRGIKIGQGRFGKVYTAVNNSSGELMAMKEITIQPNETRAIKKVAEELKIFEGISHKFLVKYYGVEIHREELLIFMELCAEGTLESLVEMSGGLYEGLNRRYTAQLLSAVCELHRHGVVHRDIKTANIFLTNGGNCLKLGDFGSAVKIQAHTTLPGELVGYVGTQAYMAPEVFTKTNSDGHGRAADVWSVGCCVIEMASGKRPWAQFDSNFQIMFKVGMGESPEAPECLSEEGHEFLSHCLEHDPKQRWTTVELLQHHFCKVDVESDCDCNTNHNIKSPRSSKTSVIK